MFEIAKSNEQNTRFQISWLLVLFAQNVYYLYVARVMHGFVAGGVVVALPVYLIEISNDR